MAKYTEWEVDEKLVKQFENNDAEEIVEEAYIEIEKLKLNYGLENYL